MATVASEHVCVCLCVHLRVSLCVCGGGGCKGERARACDPRGSTSDFCGALGTWAEASTRPQNSKAAPRTASPATARRAPLCCANSPDRGFGRRCTTMRQLLPGGLVLPGDSTSRRYESPRRVPKQDSRLTKDFLATHLDATRLTAQNVGHRASTNKRARKNTEFRCSASFCPKRANLHPNQNQLQHIYGGASRMCRSSAGLG